MEANEKLINTFATRVRQMILQYKEVCEENQELYAMVDEKDEKIRELQAQVAHIQREYDTLKMARMLQVTDGDIEVARKRVNKLVRDVNKCITLLSEG